tara:strand:- start:1506 stop:2489 length:984 start_codon:yes stop_codon:yes gene_type:complete
LFHVAIIESINEKAIDSLSRNSKYSYEVIENFDENKSIDKLKDADAIAIRTGVLSEKAINQCKKLKIISRHGVGYDNIDLEAINKRNIPLTITINANALTVAEHVFAMMFYFNKNITKFDKSVRNNQWSKLIMDGTKIITINSELYNKSIFILGYGRIGKELASRCLAFKMNIYIYDPFINKDDLGQNIKKIDELEDGFSIADYISIHIPLSEKTRNLINKKNLIKMKPNAFIINTSRGGIINEDDLNTALNDNIISGAGLDVFDEEPILHNHNLLNNSKVIMTPHIAAHTSECWERHGRETLKNITDYFDDNLDLNTVVNRDSINL